MTDMELADLLKEMTVAVKYFDPDAVTKVGILWPQIIAALRRGPDEIDAAYALRMVYLMLRSLRAEIPPGRSSMLDRDRLRNEVLDEVEVRVGEMQASENLRSERPPSGEMVMVLTELVRLYDWRKEVGAAITDEQARQYGREKKAAWEAAKRVLSAAEAEGRKP